LRKYYRKLFLKKRLISDWNVSCWTSNTPHPNLDPSSFRRCIISCYNVAFVNSERWLAKSHVDITQCQHGNVGKFLSLYFFVLCYKTNIKHFFRIDIQLYQHSWKLGKLEIVWKHSARFHTISHFPNFHLCWYNCKSTQKMFYIC
jgi:hypothetical protein